MASRRLIAVALLVPALVWLPRPLCQEPSEPAPSATPRLSRLQGSAILERNRPVAGATVVIRSSARPGELYVTATNAKGAFRIEGLADGTYEVEFRREGLLPVTKDKVEVHAPFRSIVEVTMKPGKSETQRTSPAPAPAEEGATLRVEGTAVSEDAAVPDVLVRLIRLDAATDPREVHTGKDGGFQVDALAAGEWELESRGLAYLPVHASFKLDRPTRVQLVLVPQPAIYEPQPQELLPREEPIPPPGTATEARGFTSAGAPRSSPCASGPSACRRAS